MSDTILHTSIRKATGDEIDDVATILAAAFADDPVFTWCLPDRQRRTTVLPAFFGLIAHGIGHHDEIHVTDDRRATALWVPPGVAPIDDAKRFEAALGQLFGPDADRTFEVVALMEEAHPHEPHHYLWFLGAHPNAQGRGLGSALLRDALARCDAEATPAYLEATSEHNRRLYERHGFAVVRELVVAGGPTLWAMWREPAQVRQLVGSAGR